MKFTLAIGLVFACTGMCPGDPLSIDSAVDLALSQRPELRRAAADVASEQAALDSSRSTLHPTASVSGFAVTQNTSMIYSTTPGIMPVFNTVEPPGTVLDLNFIAMVPLSTGGRLERDVAAQLENLLAARESQKFEVISVVRDTRRAFLRSVLAHQTVLTFHEMVEKTSKAVEVAQVELQAGRVAKLVVLRAQSELSSARQQENDALADEQTALSELKRALALPQTASLDLNGALDPGAVPTPLEPLLEEAQQQRPDLLAARLRVRQADEEIAAARARYRPEIYAVGMMQGQAVVGSARAQGGESLGLAASLPLFDGGLRQARLKQAEAQRNRMLAEADTKAHDVALDVARAHIALSTAFANQALALPAVAEAEEGFRVTQLRYGSGRGIQLEVLDALATLVRARVNRLKTLYQYRVAESDLRWSVGRK